MEHVLGYVALAAGIIIGLGAIGACIGIGIMAANTSSPPLVSLS